jgi:hypothetical protein
MRWGYRHGRIGSESDDDKQDERQGPAVASATAPGGGTRSGHKRGWEALFWIFRTEFGIHLRVICLAETVVL